MCNVHVNTQSWGQQSLEYSRNIGRALTLHGSPTMAILWPAFFLQLSFILLLLDYFVIRKWSRNINSSLPLGRTKKFTTHFMFHKSTIYWVRKLCFFIMGSKNSIYSHVFSNFMSSWLLMSSSFLGLFSFLDSFCTTLLLWMLLQCVCFLVLFAKFLKPTKICLWIRIFPMATFLLLLPHLLFRGTCIGLVYT